MDQKDSRQSMPGSNKSLALELSRYLTASVIGTAVHYGLMMVLIYLVATDKLIASTIGAIVGAIIIYTLNYYVTFQSTKTHQVAAARFAIVACLSVVMNYFILNELVIWFDWHIMLLQGFTTLAVFCLTYLLNKAWTF